MREFPALVPIFKRLAAAALLAACAAQAQVPPSADEAARYVGLHAAAHRGDVAAIRRLAAAGADLNAREARGRTPLHVATFARKREAIRALARAGADLQLLEDDRYDCVTIAAVADDEGTLRVLLELGASARLVTSRYDGSALIDAGANLQIADREGRTPLALARARGYNEMARMLEAAGAR